MPPAGRIVQPQADMADLPDPSFYKADERGAWPRNRRNPFIPRTDPA